jgi:hypothetical protein
MDSSRVDHDLLQAHKLYCEMMEYLGRLQHVHAAFQEDIKRSRAALTESYALLQRVRDIRPLLPGSAEQE